MRVRIERLEAASRSATFRALLAIVFGGLGVLIAAFFTYGAIEVFLEPPSNDSDLRSRPFEFALAVLLTVGLPLLAGAPAVAWGARERRRFGRLRRLALLGLQAPELTAPQIAEALGLSRRVVDRLLSDAMALGMIDGLAAPVLATAATVKAHAATPAMGPTATSFAATVLADSAGAGAPPHASSGRVLALASSAAHASAPAPTRRAALGFGTVLGGAYQVEEPLGEGGMGVVHAARHLRTGRRYAVKTMLAGARAGEEALRRFEREATAASALGHPGIVQVHDFNVTPEGLFYLVMDLLEGETLEQRLEREGGALPWADARRIAVELCAALGAAHEQGLLHRDLKPSNVFLAKSSRASATSERTVLVDFGLVKALDERGAHVTTTGAVVGTPMYMSPEQARGDALDVRSDLYSLGAVLFECLTGSPPFVDRTVAAVYARLLNEQPPRASKVGRLPFPHALDALLLRALAKDRAARFPTALALGEALAAVSEEAAPSTEAFREGAPSTEPAPTEDAPSTQAAPATERMSR